jgi:hypothetical protein
MKNNYSKMILFFLAGLIIGGAIVWFFLCGCCNKKCDHYCKGGKSDVNIPVPVSIDTITANNYFINYMLSPEGVDTLKAFAVNLAQYNAMSLILDADNTVQGFRIYMGATDTTGSGRITMIVGFGTPDHTETIYSTDSEGSGICPYICDETSPIIQPK